MNHIIYTLVLIIALYQISSAQNQGPVDYFDCSTAQPPAVNCAVDPNCLYSNPNNCSRYFQCNDAGLAYDMECAPASPPLVFNPNTGRCGYADEYTCPPLDDPPAETTTEADETTTDAPPEEAPETTSPPEAPQPETTTAPPAPETTSPPPEQPETTSASPEEAPEEPTTAPPEETTTQAPTSSSSAQPPDAPPSDGNVCLSPEAQSNLTAGCPAPRNCMFPNPNTCQGFVQCVAGGPPDNVPIAYEMPCAQGNDGQPLYWNDITVTCERQDNSTCNATQPPPEANPTPAPTAPPTEEAPEQPTTTPAAEEPETTSPPNEEIPETTTAAEEPQPEPTTEEPAAETTTADDDEDAPTAPPTTEAAPEETTTETTTPPTSTAASTAAPTDPSTEPSTAAPTDPSTEPSTAAPTTAATTVAPTSPPPDSPPGSDNPCLSPEAQSNLTAGCPAPRNCMFPNTTNCQRFVQCQAGGPAEDYVPIAYDMPCAYGHNGQLYWNDNTVTCEERNNNTCPNPPNIMNQTLDRRVRSVLFASFNSGRSRWQSIQ